VVEGGGELAPIYDVGNVSAYFGAQPLMSLLGYIFYGRKIRNGSVTNATWPRLRGVSQ
jgi:hypothetical protein